MRGWLGLVSLMGLVMAQNSITGAITIVSPSAGATMIGVVSVDVTTTGAVGALTATLTRDGVFGAVASSPLTKSGNDHYVAVLPLPTVTADTAYTVTVSDGKVSMMRAFLVGAQTSVPPVPPNEHAALMTALLLGFQEQAKSQDAQTKELKDAIAAITRAIAPLPTPQGIACQVVSATTVYASTGHYKVTLDCPQTIAPAPPAKGMTVQVLGQASSGAVVK